MAKLFVSDLDGTLLNTNHDISEKSLEGLNLLKEAGYEIALCSGRILQSVKVIGELAGIDSYYIGNNGAIIGYDDEIIYKNPIPRDTVSKLLSIAKRRGYDFHMYDDTTYYSDKYDPARLVHLYLDDPVKKQAEVYTDENVLDYIYENDIDIYKVMFHMSFADDIETYNEVKSIGGLYLAMSGAFSSDIMIDGVSKGNAIKELEKLLNKKYDKIVCIGDHENDIPMIELADIGIAMGNAIDLVKSRADYITDTNINEGFYKAVKYILEGERID